MTEFWRFEAFIIWHQSNARLAQKHHDVSGVPPRWENSHADLIHMFWTCPRSGIILTLSQIFLINITANPLTALFGISTARNMSSTIKCVITFLRARCQILLQWKNKLPNTKWLLPGNKTMCYILEKFNNTWNPFLKFTEEDTSVRYMHVSISKVFFLCIYFSLSLSFFLFCFFIS